MKHGVVALIGLGIVIMPVDGQAQGWIIPVEGAKFIASNAAPGEAFGDAVAIDGDTALVGQYHGLNPGGPPGSVIVFQRSGSSWTEQAVLVASDGLSSDHFGFAVDLNGDTAVVGAWSDDHAGGLDAGAVYVFTRSGSTWTEEAKLTASDATSGDHFGYAVSLSGDYLAIGAQGVAGHRGAAYVFVRNGDSWQEQEKLTASDADQGAAFGNALAVAGSTVVIGAPSDNLAGLATHAGSTYVFDWNGSTWTETAKLTAPTPAHDDGFGVVVDLDGDTLAVGCGWDDHAGGAEAGSAHVYTRSGSSWSHQATLVASDAESGAYFGLALALDTDLLVVGAPWDDTAGGLQACSAYVFARSGSNWIEQAKLLGSDSAAEDDFGSAVDLDAGVTIIGAPGNDSAAGVDVGAAYAFSLTATIVDIGQALAGVTGLPHLVGQGTFQPGSLMALGLANARPLAVAPFVVGVDALFGPFKGGVLVPRPDFIFPLFTSFTGEASFGGPWPPGVPSGFTTYFQWWVQDPAGPKGFAASNALAGTAP